MAAQKIAPAVVVIINSASFPWLKYLAVF